MKRQISVSSHYFPVLNLKLISSPLASEDRTTYLSIMSNASLS